MRIELARFVLVLAFVLPASAALASRTQSKFRFKSIADPIITVDSVNDDMLCGASATQHTNCFNWKLDQIVLSEPIQNFADEKDVVANRIAICGKDSGAVRCIRSTAGIDVRGLLSDANAGTIRYESYNICALVGLDRALRCLVPYWPRFSRREFTVKTTPPITTFGVNSSDICWTDGAKVDCLDDGAQYVIAFAGAFEIMPLHYGTICMRSLTAARCFSSGRTVVELPTEFLTAAKWMTDRTETFCAVTQNQFLLCVNPKTGKLETPSAQRIPPDYTVSGAGVKDAWLEGEQNFCVLETDLVTIACWDVAYGILKKAKLAAVSKSGLFGEVSGSFCVITASGQLICGFQNIDGVEYYKTRSLTDSPRLRALPYSDGSCVWNRSGIDCWDVSGLPFTEDLISVEEDSTRRSRCAIVESKLGRRTIACADVDLVQVPLALEGASSISVGRGRACGISNTGLFCWGAEYPKGDVRPSSFVDPIKVEVGPQHACAIDSFGFVCWGDLDSFHLKVPSRLGAPGVVADFALGANRTCVLRSDEKIECWGDLQVTDEEPPPIVGVKALKGSREHAFCAQDSAGIHCWGGDNAFPR